MSDLQQPFEGYDDLSVPEVIEQLGKLDADAVGRVKEYEAAHQDRKGISQFGLDSADLEPFKPEGLPTARETAEQLAADEAKRTIDLDKKTD